MNLQSPKEVAVRKTAIALAAALVLSFAGGLRAMEVSGVQLPDTTNVAGTPLVLNGAGLRTKLMLKIYVVGLYVPAKTTSADAVIHSTQLRRARLVMKRDLGAATVWDAFDEGIQANSSPAELAAIAKELVEIEKLFTDLGEVKEGDVIDIDFPPNGDTIVTYQNQPKGKIASKPLQQALLKIWLGSDPVQSDLKEALLKGK
jgi:Chalcone isomerase-like